MKLNNPLSHFKDMMIDFQIIRNSNVLSTVKGLMNTETSTKKKYVGFFPEVDVQSGDILYNISANIQYFVVDVDISTWMGNVSERKAFYQTQPPAEQSPSSTVFNINNPSNSIIGNQQQAILNNSSFNIDDLKQLIELYGNNDKKQLYELSSQLEKLLLEDTFHKGNLSKFSDLISKHSWLPLAIAQIISAFIQMPH